MERDDKRNPTPTQRRTEIGDIDTDQDADAIGGLASDEDLEDDEIDEDIGEDDLDTGE